MTSVADALKECKRILVDEDIDASQDFLLWLVRHHPKSTKTRNVTRVLSNTRIGGKGDGFCIEFQDGHFDSVSYKKCCTSINKERVEENDVETNVTSNSDLQEAMRNEVLSQTRTYRLNQGYGGDGDEMHVGHGTGEQAFCEIARSFIATVDKPIVLEKRKQRSHHTYTVYYFKDTQLAEQWRRFHQDRASLKMQTREDNIREGSKGPRT